MKPVVSNALQGAAVATVVFVVGLLATPFRHGLLVQTYVLVLGGIVLAAFVLVARGPADRRGSALERALALKHDEPERPAELARLEREVVLGRGNAFYLHFRLRNTLREIAAHRLGRRHGLELDRDAAAVEEVLGPDAWELLRPDRPAPFDQDARGIADADLKALVDRLERMGT